MFITTVTSQVKLSNPFGLVNQNNIHPPKYTRLAPNMADHKFTMAGEIQSTLAIMGLLLALVEGAKIYCGNNRGINLLEYETIACLLSGSGVPC